MPKATLAALLVFAACASTGPDVIPARTEVLGFDFRPRSAQGFLFSPSAYAGDYERHGLVRHVAGEEKALRKGSARQHDGLLERRSSK